jgi:hypothetical protein
MIDAQNLNGISSYSIWHNEWRARNDEFTRAGDATGTPYVRIVRKQLFDVLQDVEGDGLRCGRVVLGNEGAKRVEILDCLRRPLNVHVVGRLGLGRSFLPFHELTQSLTCW